MMQPVFSGHKGSDRAYRAVLHWLLVLVAGVFMASAASAVCLGKAPLRGVNLSGAEFNSRNLPGTLFRHYTYPSAKDFRYFADKGANLIRLPVRWERVQRELRGELHGEELSQIRKAVNHARDNRQCLLLDLHNYAAYHGEVLGEGNLTTADFIDLWSRLAAELDDPGHVALGLMNEPFRLAIADWASVAQDTVTALREAGSEHLIVVSGGRWSGVHEWFKTRTGSSNAEEFADLSDPRGRSVLEVHQYLNEGYSGTQADCLPPEHFNSMFENISRWARDNDQQLLLGEFGSPARAECLESLERVLELTNDPSVWRGWAYWAAGAWWGDYFLTVHPDDGEDRPQMGVLEDYFRNWSCAEVGGGQCPEPPEDLVAE